MIEITNCQRNLRVTSGAYRNYFRHLGYKTVEETEEAVNSECGYTHVGEEAIVPATLEDSSEEIPEEAEEGEVPLSEIPLGEMTLSQLYAYAEELGLDYEGISKAKDMRKLIRDHLK